MAKCPNKVSQFVPKGYGYKEIWLPCGSTDIHGGQLICESCETRMKKQYPKGWRHTPGDICKHGTYVGDAGRPDSPCAQCESE